MKALLRQRWVWWCCGVICGFAACLFAFPRDDLDLPGDPASLRETGQALGTESTSEVTLDGSHIPIAKTTQDSLSQAGAASVPIELAEYVRLPSVNSDFTLSPKFVELFRLSYEQSQDLQSAIDSLSSDLVRHEASAVRSLETTDPSSTYFYIPPNPKAAKLKDEFVSNIEKAVPEFVAKAFLAGAENSVFIRSGNFGRQARLGRISALEEGAPESVSGDRYFLENAYRYTGETVPEVLPEAEEFFNNWRKSASGLSVDYFEDIPPQFSHIISPE